MSKHEPELSRGAFERLRHLSTVFRAQIYDDAQRFAITRGLDTISAKHIEDAARRIMEGDAPRPRLKGWGEILGGVGVGAFLPGLITEFTQPQLEWNLVRICIYIACGILGVALIAWAKYPR